MTRAAANDKAHLAGGARSPDHDPGLGERDNVGVSGGEAFERLVHRDEGIVDQFLVDVDLR